MKTISRYIMTLALLLTAVTGAWAQTETLLTTINASSDFQSGSKTFDNIATVTLDGNFYGDTDWAGTGTITVTPANDGVTITSVKFSSNSSTIEDTTAPFQASQAYDSNVSRFVFDVDGNKGNWSVIKIEVYGTAEPPITVAWNASTKSGTFAMPGSDVVLTPIYAKAAAFATTGTEPDVKTLLPAAAEGVIAGTDAPLIVEGTVAFAGQSTEATQGTVMYAVTAATVTEAPALTSSDWKNTVPTAKDIADDGAEVKVWYYIQGADTPEGVAATLDNTFNNSDVCATPLTVTVRSNKFDLALNPANANTIDATQASKGTVSVAGTDKTSTLIHSQQDGTDTLKSVKMGSEVKLKAKPGYKFRKVEVKKVMKPVTLKDALVNGATVVINYTWMDTNVTTFTYTNNGGTYTGNTTGYDAEYFANGMSMDGTTLKFTASNPDHSEANVNITFYTESNGYYINSKGGYFSSFTISVDGTDLTSQLERLK